MTTNPSDDFDRPLGEPDGAGEPRGQAPHSQDSAHPAHAANSPDAGNNPNASIGPNAANIPAVVDGPSRSNSEGSSESASAADELSPAEGWRAHVRSWEIGRRAFLGGTGASAFASLDRARAQANPPRFIQRGRKVELDWGNPPGASAWSIDPEWFVRNSRESPVKLVNAQTVTITGRFAATNVGADSIIKLVFGGNRWTLQWTYGKRQLAPIPLTDWIGDSWFVLESATLVSVASDTAAVVLDGEFTGVLHRPFSLKLRPAAGKLAKFSFNAPIGRQLAIGLSKGTVGEVLIEPYADEGAIARPPTNDDLQKLLGTGPLRRLRVTLDTLLLTKPADGWPLGRLYKSILRAVPTKPKIVVEAIETADGDSLVAAGYAADGIADLWVGDPDRPRALAIERFRYTEVSSGQYGLSGQLASTPAMVQSLRYVATVFGKPAQFQPNFCNLASGKRRLTFPIVLQTLHVRGQDQARYDIDFRSYVEGGQFLDRSHVVWDSRDVDGVGAELTIGEPYAGGAEPAGNHLHIGAYSSRADVALHRPGSAAMAADQPILRVRRAEDGLDLGLLFQGYRLLTAPETTLLKRGATSQRGLRFHPQHLQEEVFTAPVSSFRAAWTGAWQTLSEMFGDELETPPKSNLRPLGDSAEYDPGRFTRLARTRVSGASRVIFAPETTAREIPLQVDLLTDWHDLPLAIPPRADYLTLPLHEQIEKIGISVLTEREEARGKVIASLVAPTASETSLELVTGLHFAPGRGARLRVPKEARRRLWTAQLDLKPLKEGEADTTVSAVWATGFKPAAFFTAGCGTGAADGPDAPFATSLDARDRSEVMLQSSAVGIAALRAVTLTGIDVPSSRVRIPRKPKPGGSDPFEYVLKTPGEIGDAKDKVQQEGVAAPSAFSRFNARLTAFGADLDAEWKGEPIAPYTGDKNSPDADKAFFDHALSVEKYTHRTSLGSDVFVEVLYKGYLLPYGFRVSLIKVTEREPWYDAELGAMMPAVQRFFIKPGPLPKTFPGIYQPFTGLEIPATSARLDFELSPELEPSRIDVPPADFKMPELPDPKNPGCVTKDWIKPPGRIFWPSLKGTTDEILFDLVAGGSVKRRSMPMLFIDNAVANHAAAMKAIHRYYNGVDARLRTEQHYGEKTVYAASAKAGDTSYETKHNVLRLANRTATPPIEPDQPNPDSDLPLYRIDAFMNGADEIPVYPALQEGLVRIPALDRLVGKPQGLKRIAYARHYLEHGFDPVANPGELYLEFLDDEVMDLGRESVAGGFAQMRSNYAGISRANAVVGAERETVQNDGKRSFAAAGAKRWNFNDVANNRFNPASFFKGATLLGVVKFEDVIAAGKMADQPKLREVFDYSAGAAGTAFEPIRDACVAAAEAIRSALQNAEAALVAFITAEPIPGWELATGGDLPNIQKCYPDLTKGLIALQTALEKTKDAGSLGDVLAAAEGIAEAWRSVRSAVDAVVANPAPEPIRGVVGTIRQIIDLIRGELGTVLQQAVEPLVTAFIEEHVHPLVNAVVDACFDPATGALVNLGLFDAFFGGLRPKLPDPPPDPPVPPTAAELKMLARALFDNPEAIPAVVLASPAGEAILGPLLQLVADLRRIQTKIEGAEAEIVEAMARAARSALESVLTAAASITDLIAAAKENVQDLCKTAAAPLSQLVQLTVDAMPDEPQVANALKVIVNNYPALDLPDLDPSPQVTAVRLAAADLRSAVEAVADGVAEVNRLRGAFVQAIPAWCKEPGWLARAVADLVNARAATLRAMSNCVIQARRLAAALDTLAAAEVGKARQALLAIRRELVFLAYRWTVAKLAGAADGVQSELERRAAPLAAPIRTRLAELEAGLRKDANDLTARYLNYPTDALDKKLDELFQDVVDGAVMLADLERRWLALATDFTAVPGKIGTELAKIPAKLAQAVAAPLIRVHSQVLDFADKALAALNSSPDFVLMLTRTPRERLQLARDAVAVDLTDLQGVAADAARAGALVKRWRSADDIGLVVATKTVADLFTAAARGQIGAIFSLDDVKRACEDAVKRFIPSRVTVHYDWATQLKANSVFLPGKNSQGGNATLEIEDGRLFAPLEITTKIEVDLLDLDKRSVRIEGKMQPFAVKLLGGMDLVTVGFTKTRFLSVNGGAPKFSTAINDFKIGSALEFLKALQESLSLGAGFAITPTFKPPGIRISYAFAQDLISFGALTIMNLSFEVAATLPLGGSPATFQFAVGSRSQPFGLIIAPCYYGGGFISMLATGSNIVEFEIQLEFGAATAIKFGPLRGQGRVSTGIYFHSVEGGKDELSGFVHAIGEGQVACFGVSISMAVQVHNDGATGEMVGDAAFNFTFRVGFASVSYGVTAEYTFKGGGAQSLTKGPDGRALAAPPRDADCTIYRPADGQPLDKMTDWLGYRSHFVEAWT